MESLPIYFKAISWDGSLTLQLHLVQFVLFLLQSDFLYNMVPLLETVI